MESRECGSRISCGAAIEHSTPLRSTTGKCVSCSPANLPAARSQLEAWTHSEHGCGQFSHSPSQCFLGIFMASIANRTAVHQHQPRGPALTHSVRSLRPPCKLPPSTGLYNFFATISCSTCLSSDRSTTKRFSLLFSSRNCRNSANSAMLIPAYCFVPGCRRRENSLTHFTGIRSQILMPHPDQRL